MVTLRRRRDTIGHDRLLFRLPSGGEGSTTAVASSMVRRTSNHIKAQISKRPSLVATVPRVVQSSSRNTNTSSTQQHERQQIKFTTVQDSIDGGEEEEQPHHKPIRAAPTNSRMPVGLGTELASTKSQCVSERDTYTEYPWIYQQHHNRKERTQFFYLLSPFLRKSFKWQQK